MIGKISSGNSFGGCLDYITRVKQDNLPKEKQVWNVLGSDGLRLNIGEDDWRKTAARDMERPVYCRGLKSRSHAAIYPSVSRLKTATD